MERDELVKSLLQGFARHRQLPGKPADHWLPTEVYDPGIWDAQQIYLHIITDGALGIPTSPPKKSDVSLPSPPKPPPPLRNEAVHAVLVGELQAEYFSEDLSPPDESRWWTPDELHKYFETGGDPQLVRSGERPFALK